MSKDETNRLGKRTKRYADVTKSVAKAGAQYLGARVGGTSSRTAEATILRNTLGNLKGPLMKVAQLVAVIPDFLPPAYAAELATLQSQAPSMGWPFVRRRLASELGPDWQRRFASFTKESAFAASMGQVHHAVAHDGTPLACKLQYPDMASTVEADLQQLKLLFSLFKTFSGAVSTQDAYEEVAQRLREELDYVAESNNMSMYKDILAPISEVHVPSPVPELSTSRLLTMSWLEGEKIDESIADKTQDERNALATAMFKIWYLPFYTYGIIHGDPHMGNYTLRADGGINLLDFGCIRIFRPELVQGVIMLFEALRTNNRDKAVEAYRLWGFTSMTDELLEALNLWARFIYAPLLEDSTRAIHETNSTRQGRKVAAKVYEKIKTIRGVRIPPEFVLIDRASIGLGSLFLRLGAEVNWYRLFEELTDSFDLTVLEKRQRALIKTHGL